MNEYSIFRANPVFDLVFFLFVLCKLVLQKLIFDICCVVFVGV